ncbi:MAG TPA: GIY-YIG nuclease family protein [Flavitalea sp.]|nr:GIY-YIG nuclease family protein [Flavitalea sp.]
MHSYYVYILTDYTKSVLYIGVTNDLPRRIEEHFQYKSEKTFTGKYYCYWLVYFEEFKYIDQAIAREKQLKGWTRSRKIRLIESDNPTWIFYNTQICATWPPPQKDPSLRSG